MTGNFRVPTKQGKQGKWPQKKSLSGKTHGICKFCQTQGFFFAQVVNSLILKAKDIFVFAAKNFQILSKLDKSAKSILCVCNSHKSHKLAQGKFAVRQGKHREFENTI